MPVVQDGNEGEAGDPSKEQSVDQSVDQAIEQSGGSRTLLYDDGRDKAVGDHVTGWTDSLTVHINEYIRYYRMVPWVLGSVGVVVFLRYSRTPIVRFRQVADIPLEFVVDNRKISGFVTTTGWNSVGVWHVPAWRWLLRWRTRPPGESDCSGT